MKRFIVNAVTDKFFLTGRGGSNRCAPLPWKTARGLLCKKSEFKRVIREGGEAGAYKIE